ncbi:hypothetical protein [Cereibacter changlensis]|uniref:hypothetical protein n=1 Tax=Cereibacter changlensis TaxID=402884 RepID=UPI004033BD79
MSNIQHPELLKEIEAYLADTGMGASYFGKKAAGASEVVKRLRAGGFVSPATEGKIRSFISGEDAAAAQKPASTSAATNTGEALA